MAAQVDGQVTNVVDAERGVVHQHRAVLVRTPRPDGGVNVLLARTVKTVRLPRLQYSREYVPHERTPLRRAIDDEDNAGGGGGGNGADDDDRVSCFDCCLCLSTVCCLLSCLPCNDRACFCLWQIITWIGLLSMIPLIAIGPLSCDPLHIISILAIVLLSAVAVVSVICFLYHCWCTREDKEPERCVLSCCGFLYAFVFIIMTTVASYLIFHVPGNFDVIMKGKYLNTTANDTTPSYIDCRLTGLPFMTIVLSYIAIAVYVGLCIGCCYHVFRNILPEKK